MNVIFKTMAKHSSYRQEDFQVASMGGFGAEQIVGGGTSTAGLTFHAITAYSDTEFSTLTDSTPYGDSDRSNITLLAGQTIYGLFTSVVTTSGDVDCYIIESTV